MTRFFKWLMPAILPAVASLSLSSCSEPESIGLGILPEGDQPGVFFTDTFTIEASTIREDSLRSDEDVAAFNLAGSYTDPVFGFNSASFYSQIRLPNNNTNFTFGSNPLLDSVVLTLAYADFYGDTLSLMQYEVYQLDTPLEIDSTYYTNDEANYSSHALFSDIVEVRPKTYVSYQDTTVVPHLRLRLDDAFGNTFINAGDANFTDNDKFITYFKGIHVKTIDVVGTGQGNITSFNLTATFSKLSFFYRTDGDTTAREAHFEINSECPRFNRFVHDYTLGSFGGIFPVPGDQRLYVQSMAGLKARIKIPHLRNLSAAGPVSINKAELVIPIEDNATYKNHQNMIIFGVDSAGKEALIPDILESSSYYGGSYATSDNAIKFNINRYVQRLVSGNIGIDYGLSIVPAGGAYNAIRSVITGTAAAPDKRIRLRVTYSKLQ